MRMQDAGCVDQVLTCFFGNEAHSARNLRRPTDSSHRAFRSVIQI